MAESRLASAFSRTTWMTVGRLLAFVVVGFGGGLLIGVASEEPELLGGHLRGDTETVELDQALAGRIARDDEAAARALAAREQAAEASRAEESAGGRPDPSDLPDVGAGPAEEAASVARSDSTDAPPSDSSPSSSTSPAISGSLEDAPAASPSSLPVVGGWAIQVGAFGDEPSAAKLAGQLEGKGYPVEVLPASAESSRWRVRVQPLDEEQAARATAERIEREERLPTWVIRLEGSPRG